MSNENFKIGDRVIYIKTNEECEIVGDTNTEYKHLHFKPILPLPGHDFILAVIPTVKDEFYPLVHCLKTDIQKTAAQE